MVYFVFNEKCMYSKITVEKTLEFYKKKCYKRWKHFLQIA